ncbi:MAG: hypothetical protein JO124_02090 [Hyphomicrobiales bacterium]|nr:hypothetical protein [Hyphomicrobiales bacterium]MBV9052964.1 hypothetical protein [Hyphomicrobiales bacterium]MBV9589194.1 hypothetical protein [Hyphomicrobiales bacterium]
MDGQRTRAARYFGRYLEIGGGARRSKAPDHELHAISSLRPLSRPQL